MNPLTDVEAALLYTVQMWGSAAYPISKLQGSRWIIGPWKEWKGFPIVFKTKKKAIEQFEKWIDFTIHRWAETKQAQAILTAVGIKS